MWFVYIHVMSPPLEKDYIMLRWCVCACVCVRVCMCVSSSHSPVLVPGLAGRDCIPWFHQPTHNGVLAGPDRAVPQDHWVWWALDRHEWAVKFCPRFSAWMSQIFTQLPTLSTRYNMHVTPSHHPQVTWPPHINLFNDIIPRSHDLHTFIQWHHTRSHDLHTFIRRHHHQVTWPPHIYSTTSSPGHMTSAHLFNDIITRSHDLHTFIQRHHHQITWPPHIYIVTLLIVLVKQ